MPQLLALSLIVAILYIGDIVSIRTKTFVPSVFVCAVLFLIGYWTIFPADIISTAGIPTVVAVMLMYMLITNMGTLLSVNSLIAQWKTVIISLLGIIGVVLFAFIIGCLLFDKNTALVAIPPLAGGIVSSLIMSAGAENLGLTELSVLAIVIYCMQGFVGYPLTALMLKKEGSRILHLYRNAQWQYTPQQLIDDNESTSLPKLLAPFIPAQYNTIYFKFLRLILVATLAYFFHLLTKPIININPFVLCLLFGILAASIGFLETNPLKKANSFGFTMLGLMLFVFNTLSKASPQMLLSLCYPLVTIILAGTLGMYLFSLFAGKLLVVSKEMAFAITLTSMYGFPADYVITQEVISSLTQDKKEQQLLTNAMLGPMLVGGFISVTIVSVILAGIFVELLTA